MVMMIVVVMVLVLIGTDDVFKWFVLSYLDSLLCSIVVQQISVAIVTVMTSEQGVSRTPQGLLSSPCNFTYYFFALNQE